MRYVFLAFLPALVAPAIVGDSFASHYTMSQPCSVQIGGQMHPVLYLEEPRKNPDGTYYPGDAFHYLIRYSASPTCVGLIVDPLKYTGLSEGGDSAHVDDESQTQFEEMVKEQCNSSQRYSGCISGMATVKHIEECVAADSGKCTNNDSNLFQKVTGLKKVCRHTPDGGIKCHIVRIVRTVTLTPEVLMPDLNVILNMELVQDGDGYDSRNLDGTYYLWDPVVVRHVPDLLWKNQRSNTIYFEVTLTPDLYLENRIECDSGACTRIMEHPEVTASDWSLGNGDGIAMYNATDENSLGRNILRYDVAASNAGLLLDSDDASTDVLVVEYSPEYSQYPYPALSDDSRTSYENRAAVALHYFGSFGGGPDDTESLHEDRRSKINGFYHFGVGFDPWDPVPFSEALSWNETRDAGIIESHGEVSESRYSDVVLSNEDVIPCMAEADGTAMLVRAGYCTIYFEYPILDTVHGPAGPRYENVTLFNTLASAHFAGAETSYLSHYEYRFPEPFFHSSLNVTLIGSEDIARVDVSPKEGVSTIRDYLYEKIVYDSADPGFGEMMSADTYPVEYSESGTDIDVKIRRVASKFESYSDSRGGDVAGLDIVSLASKYLGNSKNVRLEVPLGVGLGALSPISVNVTVGDTHRHYSYDYADFGADSEILINMAQNNTLKISGNSGSVVVRAPDDFGGIAKLYVNDTIVDATCGTTCVIGTDGSPGSITAENFWGGQAHGKIPESVVEKTPSASSNVMVLGLFVLSLPVTYWIYRNVKNRG